MAARYLVAARKYRPALFSELVAQEHVTETLKNALRMDRLAHAYLFSGPRGVGKTTAARILAKAINCTTPLDERADGAEPCRTCESCRAFEEGRSLGIFEIDAASNNKVDDIRELRETVRIPPQGSKKKVYIVDEVHMLSNQAFNALLKTLEEPPPHVLFIFATTEPHKVLPTILSRCQRFDFRRIPLPAITERLREICDEEAITADEESLTLLARKGDGALRDALSAFDQAVSLCGTELTYGALATALGVVDRELYFQLTDAVASQRCADVLQLVDRVVRAGYDLQEFLTGVAEHLRNLLVARTMDDLDLIEAASSTRDRYANQAQTFAEADLLRLLLIAGDAEEEVKQSTQPRLRLEMALLKMARLAQAADLGKALAQIDRLEQMAREGQLPAAPPAEPTPAEPPAADEPAAEEPAAEEAPEASPAPAPASEEATADDTPPDAPPSAEGRADDDAREAIRVDEEDPMVQQPEDGDAAYASEPEEPPRVSESPPTRAPSPQKASPAGDRAAPDSSGYRDLFGAPALRRKKSRPPEDAPSSGPEDAARDETGPTVATAPEGDSGPLDEHWPGFVAAVRKERVQIGTLLREARPLSMEAGTLRVAVPSDFHRRTLHEAHAALMDHLPAPLRAPLDQLRFEVRVDQAAAPNPETAPQINPYDLLNTMRAEHPVVRAIFEEFGGEPAH